MTDKPEPTYAGKEAGGMPDLFDMAREMDPDGAPRIGEYVEGGHAAVVEDVE